MIDLQDAFKFTQEDLDHNRTGDLSPRQQAGLAKVNRNTPLGLAATIFVTLLLALVTVAIGGVVSCITGMLAVIGLLLMVTYIIQWQRVRADMAFGKCMKISGAAKFTQVRGEFVLMLDTQSFRLSTEEYQSMSEGRRYAVYYTPNGKTILSVEQL